MQLIKVTVFACVAAVGMVSSYLSTTLAALLFGISAPRPFSHSYFPCFFFIIASPSSSLAQGSQLLTITPIIGCRPVRRELRLQYYCH